MIVSSWPSSRRATTPPRIPRRAPASAPRSARSAARRPARRSARPRATPEPARRSARPREPSVVLLWVVATSTRSRKKGSSRRTRLACRTRGTRCAEFPPRGRPYTLGGGERARQRGPDDRLAEDDVGARLARFADEWLVIPRNDDDARPPPRARQHALNHHIA